MFFSCLRIERSRAYCFTGVRLSVFLSVHPKLNLKTKHFPVTPKLSKNSPFAGAWCFATHLVSFNALHI